MGHIAIMVDTFAALAEPNRFRIVELLRGGPRPVNDIGLSLRLNQPQVSKHLRVLKEAGLVDVEPRAQQRLYHLRASELRRLHEWLERYRRIWQSRFNQLDEVIQEMVATMNETDMRLQGDREIVISRTFNAPARIVFDAVTKPELVKRWWAPKSHGAMVSCEADVRVGGAYRYVMRQGNGPELAFSGTYLEVTPPTRLVYEEIFEPMKHLGAVKVTVTFEEKDGKTRIVNHSVYPSREVRDGVLASGMEHGMREAMDQLDALVVSLG
jgi:uncharacterized protein YndB with AHSA1/START domain/DNA-binding transcriptional ArsR family regulator